MAPLDQLVAAIRQLPEYVKYDLDPTRPGQRPIDPIIMVKAMMLPKWFGLFDPQLEEQLKDRISFRRFVGLMQNDPTPDETSFVRFRDRLREAKLDEMIFTTILFHIEKRGLWVKRGTVVDATIIEQARGKKTGDKNDAVSEAVQQAGVEGESDRRASVCLDDIVDELSPMQASRPASQHVRLQTCGVGVQFETDREPAEGVGLEDAVRAEFELIDLGKTKSK